MHDIQLHLTNAQFKKAVGGKSFQLSNAQLTNPDKNITLSFSNKSDYSKLMRNTRNGIGYRFMPSKFSVEESFDGGYIDANLGKTTKKQGDNLVFNAEKTKTSASDRMAHVRSCKKNCKKSESEEIIDGGKFKIGRAIKRGVRKAKKTVNKTAKTVTKTANNTANNTVKTYNNVANNKHVKASAKVVKKQSVKLAKAGAKELGKMAADKAIDLGFEGLKYGANYAGVPDEISDKVLDKTKKIAKKKARAGIDKMNGKEHRQFTGSGLGNTVALHSEKNHQVNDNIMEKNNKKTTIKGKGFLL